MEHLWKWPICVTWTWATITFNTSITIGWIGRRCTKVWTYKAIQFNASAHHNGWLISSYRNCMSITNSTVICWSYVVLHRIRSNRTVYWDIWANMTCFADQWYVTYCFGMWQTSCLTNAFPIDYPFAEENRLLQALQPESPGCRWLCRWLPVQWHSILDHCCLTRINHHSVHSHCYCADAATTPMAWDPWKQQPQISWRFAVTIGRVLLIIYLVAYCYAYIVNKLGESIEMMLFSARWCEIVECPQLSCRCSIFG